MVEPDLAIHHSFEGPNLADQDYRMLGAFDLKLEENHSL